MELGISFYNLVLLFIVVIGAIYFAMSWLKDRRRQEERQQYIASQRRDDREELLDLQTKQAEIQEKESHRSQMLQKKLREELLGLQTKQAEMQKEESHRSRMFQKELREELLSQSMEFREQESTGPGSGGYIILDLPQDQIPVFHDLLNGFEDFAKIKGYEIRFSSDTTFPNKIAFKFTLGDEGINVSTQRVKKDLQEYIQKVKSGESLDDLPMVLPEAEHNLLLTLMKNRINFLQHSYNLKKNAIEFYEKLIDKYLTQPGGILPAPTVMVQTGGTMDSRSYKAIDSTHVIQGDSNKLIDTSIKIGKSFNERKNQIDQITQLIEVLKKESGKNREEKEQAALNLEKIKDEIADEEKPDKGRIIKWFQKIQNCLKDIEIAKNTVDKAKQVFDSFGLSDLLAGLF